MRSSLIKKITVSSLKMPLLQEFATAKGTHQSLENVLFSVELSDGTKGFGEAAVATHITGETIKETEENLESFGSCLAGKDAADYLKISANLNEGLPKNKAAIAAIETAVLDALTRQMRIPLWKFFGLKPKKLTTDITIVICEQAEAEVKARDFYAQGFRAYKIKIGRDFDMDLKRVLAVVKIIKKSKIILDANQGYTAGETLKFLKCLKQYNIRPDLIEQPVPKEDWEGLKRVNRLSKTLVCADESVQSLADCLRAIREKAVGAINIKLMKSGFIQSREIALWAHRAGIKLMIGGMMETSLAMTAAAHLASGMGCFDYVDLDTPFFVRGDLKRNPYLSRRGVYDLAQVKAGIGIVL